MEKHRRYKMAVDLSTAGIKVGYAFEATANTKPSAFINIPNPKSIPDFNPEPSTYDVTSLNDTEYKRYIQGLKDVGGALGLSFGMSETFQELWETICTTFETNKAGGKRMWLEFYHPSLTKGFFFTCEPTSMGWSQTDVDSVWDVTVSVTPTGEIGWETAVSPTEAGE